MRSIYPIIISPFVLLGIVGMVLALLLPIYTNSTKEEVTIDYKDSNNVQQTMTVMATKRIMTMWDLTTEYDELSGDATNLKIKQPLSQYFNCANGNTFIQGMKGFTLVTIVTNVCNFAVCIVHACLSDRRILKCPLLVFLIVAVGCCLPVAGATLLNLFGGWCGHEPLKDQGYKFGISFYAIMSATGTTLVAMLMTICA